MVNEQPRLASVPDEAMEAVERRNHWFRLAVELGQQDDFTALLAHERQQVAEQIAAAIEQQRDPDGFDIAVNLDATITELARIAREIASQVEVSK